jgi:hypothetical protein
MQSSSQATGAVRHDRDVTVFRAFELGEFLEWPVWERLQRILRSNGGSYGVSGPRGAGKSWLMMRAIEWVRQADDTSPLGGIGLWYPSPSEYRPLDFLASLSDSLANEIDRWYRANPLVKQWRAWVRAVVLMLGVSGAVAAFLIALSVLSIDAVLAVAIAVGCGVIVALGASLLIRRRTFPRETALVKEASVVRDRARYTATRTEGTEYGGEGGRGGFKALAKRTRMRELVERPATLSSLVNDFRALATLAGEAAGHVVIAIDELDKMDDPKRVRELLRDIKGIFEVPRVHFLVSVSDEAARKLSLGALADRNEFNSSFYTVIEAQPATPEHLAELLERRSQAGVPREVAIVLAVLAGGNPREVLRLAELAGAAATGADAVARALEDEALTLRREIVTAPEVEGRPSLAPEARVGAFTALSDESFASLQGLSAIGKSALQAPMWEPKWVDDGFRSRFGEAWHRLMLRLAVAGSLAESPSLVRDPELGTRLRDAIVATSQSAEVGRVVLERELRVETQQPALDREAARTRLEELARQYERVREGQPPSDDRTAQMDAVAADARAIAREAQFSTAELTDQLASEAAGNRVVALAVVEATGDPEAFEPVLTAAVQPHTPFEGYHGLRALETMSPSLSASQRDEVRRELTEIRKQLAKDPPRLVLAERILKTLDRARAPNSTTGASAMKP